MPRNPSAREGAAERVCRVERALAGRRLRAARRAAGGLCWPGSRSAGLCGRERASERPSRPPPNWQSGGHGNERTSERANKRTNERANGRTSKQASESNKPAARTKCLLSLGCSSRSPLDSPSLGRQWKCLDAVAASHYHSLPWPS